MKQQSVMDANAPARLTIRVEEAAETIGIGRGLAYELCRTGQLPCLRLGRRLVVPRASLAQWLEDASRAVSRD